MARINELADLELVVSGLNELRKNKASSQDMQDAVDEAKRALKEFNKDFKLEQFNAILADGERLNENGEVVELTDVEKLTLAIKALNISEYVIKDNKETSIFEVALKDKQIDLIEFNKFIKSKNRDWEFSVSKLSTLYCLRAIDELSDGDSDKAALKEKMCESIYARRVIDKMKAGDTPTSNNKLYIALKETCQEIIPGVIITAAQNNYIRSIMCKRTSTLKVKLPTDKEFMVFIMDVLHGALTNKFVSYEYKEKKQG